MPRNVIAPQRSHVCMHHCVRMFIWWIEKNLVWGRKIMYPVSHYSYFELLVPLLVARFSRFIKKFKSSPDLCLSFPTASDICVFFPLWSDVLTHNCSEQHHHCELVGQVVIECTADNRDASHKAGKRCHSSSSKPRDHRDDQTARNSSNHSAYAHHGHQMYCTITPPNFLQANWWTHTIMFNILMLCLNICLGHRMGCFAANLTF